MAWQCRIDPQASNDSETIARTPMGVVRLAQDLNLWPVALRIASADLPQGATLREQWRSACATCAMHGSAIWIDDQLWDVTGPLQPMWPPGDPMQWDRATPLAWDAETDCLTPDAGAMWWRRQRGSGPWVIGYVADPAMKASTADISAALHVLVPSSGVRVYLGERQWWCAWRRASDAPSGAEWCRQMWATLGAVAVGAALVTTDPESWSDRLQQAIQYKKTEPGARIKALPAQEARAVRTRTREQMAEVQAAEARRRAAQAEAQERERAQKAAEETRAAQRAQLEAERAQLQAEIQRLEAQQAQRDQAEAEALAREVDALRQRRAELATTHASVSSSTARGGSHDRSPDADAPVSPDDTSSILPMSEPPEIRRHRIEKPSHWRPMQPIHWDREMAPPPPKRHGIHIVRPPNASPDSVPPVAPDMPADAFDHAMDEPPLRMEPAVPPASIARALTLPWTAWVWGDDRRAGASTAALAFARWLASVQTVPVRLLDGHLTHPGLGRLIYPGQPAANPVRPGLGWEAMWSAGIAAEDPPRQIRLMEGQLQVWALGQPIKVPHPEQRWRQTLQRMTGAAVVIDGGIMPPPMPVALTLLVVSRADYRPNVPSGTWLGYRHVRPDGGTQVLKLPSESLDWEGVGSIAWMDVWQPIDAQLWPTQQEGQGSS